MKILIVLLAMVSNFCFGQGIDSKWVYGYSCCQGAFGGSEIDFQSGIPNVILKQRYMNFYETSGYISNRNGNVLFTSNGIYVANALDDTMQNGNGLNPSSYTTQMTSHGLAIPQGNLVIPFPNDSNKYYLFHETVDILNGRNFTLHLYYSIIDMTLNNGLGAVIQKNIVLLNDSLIPGRLTACKHANGRDWWIFAHQYQTGLMYEYLISPSGISAPVIQNVVTPRNVYFGQCLFSPQGNRFAYYEPFGDLDILDFDRCSGIFSNLTHIDINDSAFTAGIAFSRSGKYLYASSQNYIYQFNVESGNIDSSKVGVAVYDQYQEQGFYQNFYLSALAPDGKIYINCGDGSKYFHIINSPDSAGLACNFVQRGLPLPRWDGFTMPNFPNYFLGADPLSVCDTINTITNLANSSIESYSVFPNPVSDLLYINHSMKEPVQEVSIVNSLGQTEPVQFISIKNGEYLQVDLSSFVSGVYYVQMKTAKQIVTRKVIKQ
jgi:hypothetical protein